MLAALLPDRGAVTVIDLEAGLEHLKRGTAASADVLLVVAEPYFRSLETAARTVELGRDLGIGDVGVVANKLRGPVDEEQVRGIFDERGIPVLSAVPFDPAVAEADRRATALLDVDPDSPAVRALDALARGWRLEEAGSHGRGN